MKRKALLIIFILFTGVVCGQTYKKGNIVGFHIGTVELAPNVTLENWETFFSQKVLPAYNKEFKGDIAVYFMKGERGKHGGFYGHVMVIKSLKVRNKYFPKEGQSSTVFNNKMKRVQPLLDELEKLGTFREDHYTDWVVQ